MSTHTNNYLESFAQVSISRTLRKYGWLLKLAKKHRIQVMLLQGITDFLDKIVNLRKEGEQLNIGLVVKNSNLKLEQSPIESKPFPIHDLQGFANLKNIVSGRIFCYLVDHKGMVTIAKIPLKISQETSSMTLKNVSRIYQTIAFCVRDSIIEIYDSGRLVRILKNGIWIKPCSMPLKKLVAKGYPPEILKSAMSFSMKMSEKRKGGVFVIVKNDLLKYCRTMIKGVTFRKCQVSQIPETQILEFADLDGAVILNVENDILGIAQKLEPPPVSDYYNEPGRGTKHHSAAMYSSTVDSVVFVISEDGPVSLYYRGNLLVRCFGELFGSQ